MGRHRQAKQEACAVLQKRGSGHHRAGRPAGASGRPGVSLHGQRYYPAFARVHTWLVVRTGGRPAHLTLRLRCLVLETTGRRSNQTRRVALLYMADGDSYVVLASNFGREEPPSWWRNLQSRPDATVRVGGHVIPVRARALDGAERDDVLRRASEYNKQWRRYAATLDRDLPVVRLEPSYLPAAG